MIKKKIFIGLVAAMMLTGTAGCGNSPLDKHVGANSTLSANTRATYGAEATEAAIYYDDAAGMDAEESFKGGVNSNASEQVSDTGADTTNQLSEIDTEKLVYHCDMYFDTENYIDSVNELKNLMNQYGAFLEYENERNNGGYGNTPSLHIYNATIRIPSENYQDFLDNMGNVGELMNKCQDVQNLSQEFSDLSSELEVLEAKRDSYIAMMKEAKTLDDMESLLMIDERLTEVEVSINQIKTRLNSINNDVAYSYITVTISEVKEYEDPAPETFGERVAQGFKNGWENFVGGCQNLVIWAAEHVIGLGIFLVILLTIWFALLRKPVKAFRARRRAAKAAKKAAQAAAAVQTANAVAAGTAEQTANAETAPVKPEAVNTDNKTE
jgi:hypothetical protein